ncbi:hypothetical protein [Nostoc sp. WHI]|uniref:hypothetical protein n=1 Tax=Nostoc sp. WHI TaxID=2650611 RepID=UPI0018C723AF|nr:hypothetical protein [Nostoc sp. WHI]MBG1265242.1 hypothetical protein [Nostoc sp. WHI]
MMDLKDLSLVSQKIQNNELLKAIETAIPATAITQARQRFATVCCKEVLVQRSLTIELMIRLYVA